MSDEFNFFSKVGGVALMRGDETAWNFGMLALDPLPGPTLHSAIPWVAGRWDGRTSISNFLAPKKVLGGFLKAQRQTSGTCGGRATSGGLNLLQCLQIAAGKASKFEPVSHGWCYAGARTLAGNLGRGDGVIAPSPLDWCKQKGVVHQRESGDADYYSDRVADSWGRSGLPRELMDLAKDNPIEDMAPCTTFQEAADAIASGGVVMVASDQGFTMTRDREGVCSPRGVWQHYMFFGSVHVLAGGRRVLGCAQSWGDNVPDGPALDGCPDYVFGVEERTAERMLSQRVSTAVLAFKGWGDGNHNPWVF